MPAPKGQRPITGRLITATFPAPSTFESKQDGDEGCHHQVVVTERPRMQRARLNPYRPMFVIPHSGTVERVDAGGGKT